MRSWEVEASFATPHHYSLKQWLFNLSTAGIGRNVSLNSRVKSMLCARSRMQWSTRARATRICSPDPEVRAKLQLHESWPKF